ncbi:TPA: hypothetical protein ACX6RB_003369 [Photobacterium damselae]
MMTNHHHNHCCGHHGHDNHDPNCSVSLQLGQVVEQHPFQFGDGAMIELCRRDLGNEIFIGLGGLTRAEIETLTTAPVELGLLATEAGGCLIVVKIGDIALDVQFNAAAIPDEHYQAEINSQVTLLALDTRTKELKVKRDIELTNELVAQLTRLTARQRTEETNQINAENAHLLNTLTPEQLAEKITLVELANHK